MRHSTLHCVPRRRQRETQMEKAKKCGDKAGDSDKQSERRCKTKRGGCEWRVQQCRRTLASHSWHASMPRCRIYPGAPWALLWKDSVGLRGPRTGCSRGPIVWATGEEEARGRAASGSREQGQHVEKYERAGCCCTQTETQTPAPAPLGISLLFILQLYHLKKRVTYPLISLELASHLLIGAASQNTWRG